MGGAAVSLLVVLTAGGIQGSLVLALVLLGIAARRQREEADYGANISFDTASATQTIADARRFVDRLEKFL